MHKVIVLGLMVTSMNVVFAADGAYTGTVDMKTSEGNQVKVERVESDLTVKGRNRASNGGWKFSANTLHDPKFQLKGRRD
ncbi:hypothetical protein [Vibrio campbellii]|jgi:hypothetical protein|uniref:Uncharacterized protein n=1 Tax=Vibrio campbellii TaxID=680 RepID=A0AAE9N644_9VIBR|nr:hypothetical protein [Vibrio campbellii]UTZ23505.1 hypothetical protein HB760_16790 [Vibrio campbellii]UTZ29358.1 hypothetical protein HB761_22310 [Vibrio campbellii]UTZ34346.1 hypothetical protein HB762_24575 [Vibrio campbellii]UTZ43977.1 hypothetical protein HB764_22325 [Vibrio campbellii]|tara:strand:- start:1527 stop:1766 length:240 start_codon:yes stop_codon:yes gene_type:complete